MKLIHLADLHIGKRVNGFSLMEDQREILAQITGMIEEEQPDAVLIAGDVYDRSIPSEEAVELLDAFLVGLARQKLDVFLISGNHDSAERMAFGARLMEESGLHVSPVYNGEIHPLKLRDDYGEVSFWLFPFVKCAHVARFEEERPENLNEAMRAVVERLPLSAAERNVALVHQFLIGGRGCDSEEQSVGGLDEVSAEVFDAFDYVALGHLHGPQSVGREGVRYAGSPLKYSFSEAEQRKSITIVELKEKGQVKIRERALTPVRDMKRLSGTFEELCAREEVLEDYCEITLTDEEDIPDAMNRLRLRYPNLMALRYDNTRTRTESIITGGENVQKKRPEALFDELYQQQNGQPMSEEQRSFLLQLIEEIWEEAQ